MTIAGLAAVVAAAGGCGWNDAVDSRSATAGLPSIQTEVEARDWVLDPDDTSITVGEDTPARDLLIGEWTVVNVNTGDAIQSMVLGTEPTLTFDDDGTIAIDTGCNTGGADWELDGDEITVEAASVTLRACEGDVMDQEAAILAALEGAERVEVTPGSLTLLDGDGRIALVAVQD